MTVSRAAALALGALCVFASPAAASALQVRVTPASPRQGDVAVFFVAGAHGAREVEGSLGGRPLAFFPYGEEYAALAGIDLESKPGRMPWKVGIVEAGGTPRKASGVITVRARRFSIQRLTLPAHMVDLDPQTERRAVAEAARLRTLFDSLSPERLWLGRFTRPVGGSSPGEGYGARRIINAQPRSPHSGIDFSADLGTPVVAANRGRVALVAEFFFAGRLIVLDHGLGLYTLYYHLDGISVSEGALVERGQTIGTVGATGRATGPHLHFGAQLRRARVDPTALFLLPLKD
jgi:murein DD-endopeptidase MepM/ murein hydrolase activator NlpD